MASRRTRPTEAKIVAFSCIHAPFTDQVAFDWMLSVLEKERGITHVVNLGDWFESAAASVHPEEHEHTLQDEYEMAAVQSRRIREAAGRGPELHWMLGNHDDNLQAKDVRRVPKSVRSLVHWNESKFGHEFRRWRQYPYEKCRRGTLEIGPVILCHGWDCGVKSDELEALQMANACGGHAHRLVIRGHTHRPVWPTQAERTARVPLPWWYGNVGTLGPLKPSYARRRDTSAWGAGCYVIRTTTKPGPWVGIEWEAKLLRP